ncbi:phosphoribosylformylglycinamidine synthase [Treponema primitia]|uniref:phosphoribosylformylglycinamidine synthase n=1 Tax=Treponema primitia TaxID=88058 RepID=UPI0002555666|nr:phosphoribosylformylglycinamidine synthase [Treponema primitia]
MPNNGDTLIRRVFVEKKEGFDIEARRLQSDIAGFLGVQYPELAGLRRIRLLQRYDAARLSAEQFELAVNLVFSEPQCDTVFYGEDVPAKGSAVFGIEYVPGQYNQRSDSAEQCVELAVGIRPVVRTARIFILEAGEHAISDTALEAVKRYLINPVDSREAALELPQSLEDAGVEGGDVPVLTGFSTAAEPALADLAKQYGLAMSAEDLLFCRDYFRSIGRDPSLAEVRVLDTYWSDHCRHTTFTTALEDIRIDDAASSAPALKRALALYEEARREVYGEGAKNRKRTLMDLATIGTKVLKKRGLLGDLDESKEINACSIRVKAEFSGAAGEKSSEPWLFLFKNETHNHPTEIEPFGGAATCLGGAIRDPLSGRAYVYQAMRVSGGADPRSSLSETLPGKLPQLKIAREASAGYSSYGNQIGLATGQVSEFYHPGFLAKRMELGAVAGAVPEAWVRREEPTAGDLVILVGGKTGRDGIGGATGSSKVHTGESVESAGAEVQKGNAVEERKLQRLFRNPNVTALIKRCNDFGAGGVAVAVGELAAGLDINLDRAPKKYAGLDGIELAISESQERMALVVAAKDADRLIEYAAAENLDAVVIAVITAGDDEDESAFTPAASDTGPRLRMSWRGKTIVDISRRFLNSNGAPRSAKALIETRRNGTPLQEPAESLLDSLERELGSLRTGSRRGLQERFDGSIGAASALYPWGGAEQGTPECGMAALLPSPDKESLTAGLMSFGYDPDLALCSPYEGAKGAIREALAKYACLGGNPWTARLSLQEYFERMDAPESWGKVLGALLGALEAELALGVPAIGGKDSMSGSYRDDANHIDLAVPPTLVAFAAGTAPASAVRSGALSGKPGNAVILLYQTGEWDVFKANMNALAALSAKGLVCAAYPVGPGGVSAALALMAFGNMVGLEVNAAALSLVSPGLHQGSVLVEITDATLGEATVLLWGISVDGTAPCWAIAAHTVPEPVFRWADPSGRPCRDTCGRIAQKDPSVENSAEKSAEKSLAILRRVYERTLAQVFPQTSSGATVADPPASPAGSIPASDEALEAAIQGGKASAGQPGKADQGHRKSAAGKAAETARPLVVLPVFPGTNCEWDMERAFRKAGARTRLVIFRNRNSEDILESRRELAAAIGEAQIVAISGGFSAGDEPDGSGKFIANVFRSPAIAEELTTLLEKRDGLILGICNGFQALIKLGLVPYGKYLDAESSMPTLSFNRIGRHVSRMVRTKIISNTSPWCVLEEPGTIHILPVSHGEGRIVIREEEGRALFAKGQVPFCYTDERGNPTMAEPDNPNGSDFAIEGLTSPDGRILGKMAHSERCGEYVHINIPGNKYQRIFEAGVRYFG